LGSGIPDGSYAGCRERGLPSDQQHGHLPGAEQSYHQSLALHDHSLRREDGKQDAYPGQGTFTIRAYGDARDKNGNIIAKSFCEAVVRRSREYVDPMDAPDLFTYPSSPQNRSFGRRFAIVSFRWLSPGEI